MAYKNKRTNEELNKISEVCMKNKLLKILDDYLLFFPEEKGRQSKLLDYLEKSKDKNII